LNIITEKILLNQIRSKDRKAAEKLIDLNYQYVYSFLYKLCNNKETAKDLTQETFIKFWNSLDGFNGHCRISTWIIKICYNTYLNYSRKHKVETNLFAYDNVKIKIDTHESFEETIICDDLCTKVYEIVEKLSPKLREVIMLHYKNDFSLKEISEILDVPKGTVKSRLNSALNELRKSFIK
jgi:RNA polymerase sigma-70 factor, ECF subfamily